MPPIRPQPLNSTNIAARPIPDPPANMIGDVIVFTDNLRDAGNNVVGQHSGFCTRVRVTPPDEPDIFLFI